MQHESTSVCSLFSVSAEFDNDVSLKKYLQTRRTIPTRNYDLSGCEEYDFFDETVDSLEEESDLHDVDEIDDMMWMT